MKCRFCKKEAEPSTFCPPGSPLERHRVPLCSDHKQSIVASLCRAQQQQPLADAMHKLGMWLGERKKRAN